MEIISPSNLSSVSVHLEWGAGLTFTGGTLSVSQKMVKKTVDFAVSIVLLFVCEDGGVSTTTSLVCI